MEIEIDEAAIKKYCRLNGPRTPTRCARCHPTGSNNCPFRLRKLMGGGEYAAVLGALQLGYIVPYLPAGRLHRCHMSSVARLVGKVCIFIYVRSVASHGRTCRTVDLKMGVIASIETIAVHWLSVTSQLVKSPGYRISSKLFVNCFIESIVSLDVLSMHSVSIMESSFLNFM